MVPVLKELIGRQTYLSARIGKYQYQLLSKKLFGKE